jgi:hypothetical protein
MIIEKQELFTPVFSEVRCMTDDPREAGTVYPRTEDKQFMLLYDHPSSNEPH